MAFKMRGFSPFKKDEEEMNDAQKKDQQAFVKLINEDYKNENEEKKKDEKDKKKEEGMTRSEIEDLYSQLNPNNPDKD
tara:strand:- start:79 stop:312 length:234 start_codon:yes stop_codon:yes gene_type:complete